MLIVIFNTDGQNAMQDWINVYDVTIGSCLGYRADNLFFEMNKTEVWLRWKVEFDAYRSIN